MQIDATGSEVLDDQACLRLLESTQVGRVALTRDALPVILPVAFGLLGRDPVVRAGSGAVRSAGNRGSVLCFEVDGSSADWSSGWSVVVIGRAEMITAPDDLVAAERLGLPDWRAHVDGPDAYVRIRSELVSGRRFSRDAPLVAVSASRAETEQ